MMNKKQQETLLEYTENKVKKLFHDFPVPAHNFDHVKRVYDWAVLIAKAEKGNIFLCAMLALLHDVGRVKEQRLGESSRKHHELSYNMMQEWFKKDINFRGLSNREKLELLYGVRYHWNNEAKKYQSAWILRDADKLDIFGIDGINRTKEAFVNRDEDLNNHYRSIWDLLMTFETETAKKIIKKNKLAEPIFGAYKRYLRSKIQPVKL